MRPMIRDRVLAGLARTRTRAPDSATRRWDPASIEAIHTMLGAGAGIRETARRTGAGTASVMLIKQTEARAA